MVVGVMLLGGVDLPTLGVIRRLYLDPKGGRGVEGYMVVGEREEEEAVEDAGELDGKRVWRTTG